MDFTLKTYTSLLEILKSKGYAFQAFEQFIQNPLKKVVVLRHDVDLKPRNSLRFAKIQNKMGIKGTYYFRMLPCSYNENIIKQIIDLGHEIGYHYENLSVMSNDGGMNKETGDRIQNTGDGRRNIGTVMSEDELFDLAIKDFEQNLEKLRKLYPVKTICMHGSPLSKIDNKRIWEKINYRDYGIIAEPYYDINFDEVLYLTDTGRRWNGDKVSIRDKVDSKFNFNFQHTNQIIEALEQGILPNKIMFTFHPQRWNDTVVPWTKELVMQNVKNVVKRAIVR
ncbi:MAG: hypothetical protein PHR06_02870 [Candidatus Cloacimonetes bacterium]|nr:hypothetical protein [Candidatus Cloacimonadota bacterium]